LLVVVVVVTSELLFRCYRTSLFVVLVATEKSAVKWGPSSKKETERNDPFKPQCLPELRHGGSFILLINFEIETVVLSSQILILKCRNGASRVLAIISTVWIQYVLLRQG
jgi:hypothetical protein